MPELKLPQWPREQNRQEPAKVDTLPLDEHRARELEHLRKYKAVGQKIMQSKARKKAVKSKKAGKKKSGPTKPKPEQLPFAGTYRDYITKSPQWKRKRKWAMRKLGRKCNRCGSAHNINVHHLSYKRLFNERLEDLEILCRGCHENEHEGDKPWIVDPLTKRFLELNR